MNRRIAISALFLVLAVPAFAAERVSDREVKALVEKIDQIRDRFEDSLDGELKRSTVSNANGQVNVEKFLTDFQNNIDRLKERITDDNPGSSEAEIVLNQASAIDGFLQRHPAETKGRSEWNQLAGDLRTLARAFGTSFPIGPNDKARRINDRELTMAADSVKASADRLEDALDDELKKIPSFTEPARKTIVNDVKLLKKDADVLSSRVGDNQPSATEADSLLERASRIDAFLKANAVPKSSAAWAGMATRVQTVGAAYQTPWTPK